jgi:trk system potassium uptake protein TrkH
MEPGKGVRGFLAAVEPLRLVVFGYLAYVLIGWVLLCLPFSHRAGYISPLDNFFTSVSAVSTTGLVTVDTGRYNMFGQIVILCLIQVGGLGYMTLGSFVILSRGRELSDLRSGVSQKVFSLPKGFRISKFIRSVVIFSCIVELCGAIVLSFIFRSTGAELPVWSSIFHSVSAFCTAGFSLYSNSFEAFADNFWLNIIIGLLSLLGAMGFIVLVDIWRRVTGKVRRITFTSKIILRMSFALLLIGAFVFLITEPSVQEMSQNKRILVSTFQAMTAMTTVGFNTVTVGALAHSSLLILTFLMIIGASPSGTGGGIKSTSFTAIFGLIRSSLRGDSEVCFLGRKIPESRIRTAMASTGFYLFVLILGVFALTLTESMAFEGLFFEAASALGTVGLSTGITSSLTSLGKIIVCILMFIGRVGPLTFAVSFSLRGTPDSDEYHDVAI